MAEETITLPKSGVVLERRGLVYVADGTDIRFRPDTRPYGSCPVAWCRNDAGHAFDCDDAGALAWLDEQVTKLRAALLPPGAIVVEDSPETVERVAQALMTQDEWNPKTLSELDDSNRSCHQAAAMRFRAEANAVLAALRESRP